MTGPEHYREAERYEALAAVEFANAEYAVAAFEMERANLHARLALAAATALQPSRVPTDSPYVEDWVTATGRPS